MSDKQVWSITGAGRGIGVDFAKAALTAGHAADVTDSAMWGSDAPWPLADLWGHVRLLAPCTPKRKP